MRTYLLFLACATICSSNARSEIKDDKRQPQAARSSRQEPQPTQLTSSLSGPKRILAVIPYQGKSHHMFVQHIIKILLDEGHHVTFFTSNLMEGNYKNLKQYSVTPTIASWADIFEFERMTTQTSSEARIDLEMLSESFLHPLYKSKDFLDLLVSDETFDLAILEPFFMQEPLVFLGHRFNCPVVALATAATETNQDLYMGRLKNPAIEAEWTTCVTSHTMDFLQRVTNTFSWMANMLEHRFYYLPKREADMHRLLSYPGVHALPPVREMLGRISLTLSNSHQLVQYPTPVPPNLIMTPGLHIDPTATLPQNLRELIEAAEHGVILFSMGTMTPVSKMKGEKQVLIDTFSKLRQLVLWKSDIDIPNLPPNIRTLKWLPQQAILGHKKCVAFITHGGMLSKQEALYFSVPLVSIPLFGDQLSNTGHSMATGLGVTILYTNLTAQNLHAAINSVIYDSKYSDYLKEVSPVFREAVSGSRNAVRFWLDHVMRFDGAAYLRRDSLSLSWFQYYLLDVVAVFLITTILAIVVLIKCAQACYRLRFHSPPSKMKKQ